MMKFIFATAIAAVAMTAAASTPTYAWSFDVLHGKVIPSPTHNGTIKPVVKPIQTTRPKTCPNGWFMSGGNCFQRLH